jgi:hypothetical protein
MKPLNITSNIAKLTNKTSFEQWEKEVDKLVKAHPPDDIQHLVEFMDDRVGRLAFLAKYIKLRALERGHTEAAKDAYKRCVRVNKALGYMFPKRRAWKI